jgi:hypothetical protein
MGRASALIEANESGTNCVLVSAPINTPGEARSDLQAIDFMSKGLNSKGTVAVGLIDEDGKYYPTKSLNTTTAANNVWKSISGWGQCIIPDSVRANLAAGTSHTYRVVIFAMATSGTYCIDSVAVGYGLVGLATMSGTSMATPVVAGMLAVAAANNPQEDAATRAARIYGSVEYSEDLSDKCSSSGYSTLAKINDPSPSPQKAAVEGDTVVVSGYFFGDAAGSVTIGGKAAEVQSWTKDAQTGVYSVRVKLPEGVSAGTYQICVTRATELAQSSGAASGYCSRYLSIDNADETSDFAELAVTESVYQTYDMNDAALCADSSGMYMIQNAVFSNLDEDDVYSQYNLLSYDILSDSWTMLEKEGNWVSLLGVDEADALGYETEIYRAFTINDQVYWAISRPDKDKIYSDSITLKTFSIVTIDKQTNKLIKVRDVEDVDSVFASGSDLYVLKKATKDMSDIATNWVVEGGAAGAGSAARYGGADATVVDTASTDAADADATYYLVYKVDLSNNDQEFVFGMRSDFGLSGDVTECTFVSSTSPSFYYVGDYLCVTLPFAEGAGVAVANLATADTSRPLEFTYYQSEFMFMLSARFTVAGDYLVCAPVQYLIPLAGSL